MKFKSLIDILKRASKEYKDKGIYFVENEKNDVFLSYNDLYQEAKKICYCLQMSGLKSGDELIFQISTNQNFIKFFWACILGNIIPVPVTYTNNNEYWIKFNKIWHTLNNPFLLIKNNSVENIKKYAGDFIEKISDKVVDMENILEKTQRIEKVSRIKLNDLSEKSIAFIQFSSGSTGDPKGVVLTHENLLTNIDSIITDSCLTEKDSTFSWMPLTHDMGLIGFHLCPLAVPMDQYIMPTQLFVRRPDLWMKKVSDKRISLLSSPNFGLKLYLNSSKLDDETLDLSCVRLIFNGAEPISYDICNEFLNTLAKYNLKRSVMFPVYGLAEASLAVTFPPPEEELGHLIVKQESITIGQMIVLDNGGNGSSHISLVDLGYPVKNTHVKIIDNLENELAEQYVGEILIKGKNVTSGYYNNPEANNQLITEDGWLKTGDAGFILNQRLYVSGRIKDIIFINGMNFYSHDIERVLEESGIVKPGRIVASGIYNEQTAEDELVLFLRYKKKDLNDFFKISNNIKKCVFTQIGLKVSHVIPVYVIPKTTSGKFQRFKLVDNFTRGEYTEVIKNIDEQNQINLHDAIIKEQIKNIHKPTILKLVAEVVKKVIGFRIDDFDENLFNLGIDSIKLPLLKNLLDKTFDINVPVSIAIDHYSVTKITDFICNLLDEKDDQIKVSEFSVSSSEIISNDKEIAVIGIGCKFPGNINTPQDFWNMLKEGRNVIGKIPNDRWDNNRYYSEDPNNPGKIITKYGGFLSDIDLFDNLFFGISPVEAKMMDPQQRLLLEVCWHGMEHAGINIDNLKHSNTGVYIGISNNDYSQHSLADLNNLADYSLTGSMFSVLSGRISYFFDFQGPSVTIDTACSSSLVSVDYAVNGLRNGNCDMAIAGGVNLIISPRGHIGFSSLNALSNDGQCKSFSDEADGYGRSEGCGIVILKRLSEAIKDNDRILAVICSSAVSHNGRSSGLTVPNGEAQQKVITSALQSAKIEPEHIDYIEGHGSGTKIGDPLEVNALANIFNNKNRKEKLLIGSVKTNIGHTESAAGIAGLIKVVLSLYNKKIPRSLNYNTPNQYIPWEDIFIDVNNSLIDWKKKDHQRIAGVSSFGISGTNAHVILKESPNGIPKTPKNMSSTNLLLFSAKTHKALNELANEFRKMFSDNEAINISDLCYSSNISRISFRERVALVGKSREDFIDGISKFLHNGFGQKVEINKDKGIVFLCTGQGSIYKNIAREIYHCNSVFRENLQNCDKLFKKYINKSIIDIIYSLDENDSLLDNPVYAQPITFSIEYSLHKLWEAVGITPSLLIGHSIGEFVAACIGGVFTLEDAIKLVANRGLLMQLFDSDGLMVTILANENQVRLLVKDYDDVSIAAINTEENITISGNRKSVEEIIIKAKKKRFFIEVLNISHAYHSVLMKRHYISFKAITDTIEYNLPQIPIVTGKNNDQNAISTSEYWSNHLIEPVQFYNSIGEIENDHYDVFVELGGTATLCGLVGQILKNKQILFAPSLRPDTDAACHFFMSLKKLYENQFDIDWRNSGFSENAEKMDLPLYPFQRESFWINEINQNYRNKTYSYKWKINELVPYDHEYESDEITYIVFKENNALSDRFVSQIKSKQHNCYVIYKGDSYDKIDNKTYNVSANSKKDFLKLFEELDIKNITNCRIIYLWALDCSDIICNSVNITNKELSEMVSGLLNIMQNLTELNITSEIQLAVITVMAQSVDDSESLISLNQSVMWGFGRSALIEMPVIFNSIIDVDQNVLSTRPDRILQEIEDHTDNQICLRDNNKRYCFRIVRNKKLVSKPAITINNNCAYLIVGGLGALGLLTIEWLIEKGAKHIFITNRSRTRSSYESLLQKYKQKDINVTVFDCDISEEDDVDNLFNIILNSEHPLAGIIHSAGVVDDASIAELTWENFKNVFESKIFGIINLNKKITKIKLDFLILYSSMASLGNWRQSNYAAANEFLNKYAYIKRCQGLKTFSINWGPWDQDVGVGKYHQGNESLRSEGIFPISKDSGIDILNKIFDSENFQPYIMDVDWQKYGNFISLKRKQTIFYDFFESIIENKKSYLEKSREELFKLEGSDFLVKIKFHIRKILVDIMGYNDCEKISLNTPLLEQGVDSLMGVQLRNKLSELLNMEIPVGIIYNYPSIELMADYFDKYFHSKKSQHIYNHNNLTESPKQNFVALKDNEPIAVVGMACRYPGGVSSPNDFYRLMENGIDAVSEIPEERWDVDFFFSPDKTMPGKMYTKNGGFIDAVDRFDSMFFEISPNEARVLDPQQRFLLEVSWEALENACINPYDLKGSLTGVFIGIGGSEFKNALSSESHNEINAYYSTGLMANTACGRLSYFYDFNGPCVPVDTACSSSLVAVHLAVKSLQNRESNMALVGGVQLILSPEPFIALSKIQGLSPDGRCKTFDSSADGFGRGEGCGFIVLKRLSEAVKDKNKILGIIKGSATGHDGKSNGLTAPNGLAQERVIQRAWDSAGVKADDISYIEVHGTGTPLGDPIEIDALSNLCKNKKKKMIVGTVKTNIGHLEAASGIAGIIKVILAMQNKKLLPNLHFKSPSPYIPWNNIQIDVNTTTKTWDNNGSKRIAGISSFGIGGTLAHIVIQEPDEMTDQKSEFQNDNYHILSYSSKDLEALEILTQKYKDMFELSTYDVIIDICYASNISRTGLPYRIAIVGNSKDEFVKKLSKAIHVRGKMSLQPISDNCDVVFLYTGQGSQYIGMGKELYYSFKVFKDEMEHCAKLFSPYIGESIVDILYSSDTELNDKIKRAKFAQPIIFSIEYSLSKLWESWGVIPSSVIGHSIGEYAAAWRAGIISLEDTVKMVAKRGLLMETVSEKGKMVTVFTNENRIKEIIKGYENSVSIAAVNSPENVTISGKQEIIDILLEKFKSERLFFEQLEISHAFHSVMMDSYVKEFELEIENVKFSKPTIKYIANRNSNQSSVTDLIYWSSAIREPVRFYDNFIALSKKNYNLFVEIGGKPTLAGICTEVVMDKNKLFLPSLREGANSTNVILNSLCRLFERGVNINWNIVNGNGRLPNKNLPSYPFKNEIYPINKMGISYNDQFYNLQWEEAPITSKQINNNLGENNYIIFMDNFGFGSKLEKILQEKRLDYKLVYIGKNYQKINENHYEIHPSVSNDFVLLFNDIQFENTSTIKIIYSFSLDFSVTDTLDLVTLKSSQEKLLCSLLFLIQSLHSMLTENSYKLWVLTNNVQNVDNSFSRINIMQSTIWGFCRNLEFEEPQLWGGIIDLDVNKFDDDLENILLDIDQNNDDQISYKNNKKYVCRFKYLSDTHNSIKFNIRETDCYLITGGLGGLGLLFAEWLVGQNAKNIVLMSRSGPDSDTIKKIDQLKKSANITVFTGDVVEENDIKILFEKFGKSLPFLKGIIHAAGSLSEASLMEQTWKKFDTVFASKVYGTWNLHQFTKDLDLDFFILFSSVSTVMGLNNHSNYLAANEFLNAISCYRREKGLPALSINWGPWAEIGMGARQGTEQLSLLGLNSISPKHGLKVAKKLLSINISPVYALKIDWKIYSDFLPPKQRIGIFSSCIDSISQDNKKNVSDFMDKLKSTNKEKRLSLLMDNVHRKAAEILGFDDYKKLIIDKPLMEQGADSLMAVQLRNYLSDLIDIPLSVTLLMNYPSIEKVSNYLLFDILNFDDEIIDNSVTNNSLVEFEKLLEIVEN